MCERWLRRSAARSRPASTRRRWTSTRCSGLMSRPKMRLSCTAGMPKSIWPNGAWCVIPVRVPVGRWLPRRAGSCAADLAARCWSMSPRTRKNWYAVTSTRKTGWRSPGPGAPRVAPEPQHPRAPPWRRTEGGRLGPKVEACLRVGGRRPELGDLAVAVVVADVHHRNLDRLAVARGDQRGQHRGVLVVREDIVHIQPERPAGLLGQPAEEAEHLIAAVVVAAERPDALGVPDGVVGDQLTERRQVSAAERGITPAGMLDIRMLGHGASPCPLPVFTRPASRTGTIHPRLRHG